MKLLQIFKSEPVQTTLDLADILAEGNESARFDLYGGGVDYDRLVELIFSCEKTVSWW
jgi:hypothetical protein